MEVLRMEARQQIPADVASNELERVIARIRMRGRGLLEPPPSPDAIAAVLARFGNEEPMSGEELAEHERTWRELDAEIEALGQNDTGSSSAGNDLA
jgi:hypothetical protein